ncbi:MAG TPA: helix-turn-helix domain-containing protein [Candidatus Acidoferrum sp.]
MTAKSKNPESPKLQLPEPILLDIAGAARALNTSVWCIRVLIREGRLPKFRLGKKYLFDPADLRTFAAEEKERQQL